MEVVLDQPVQRSKWMDDDEERKINPTSIDGGRKKSPSTDFGSQSTKEETKTSADVPKGISWSSILRHTTLHRTNESKTILECFHDSDRKLLLIEGPCGGT